MSANQILEELERVYGNRSRLADLQNDFLNRKWRWREDEKFFDYYQEKVRLGSNFNLPEDILVKRIISGIDNAEWERQLNAYKIVKTSVLLEKMENAIRDYMMKSSNVSKDCQYCKKNNHPSNKCHFKPDPTKEIKPVPCKYCKIIGHSPAKCYFKKDDDGSEPNKKEVKLCKYCSKPGHLPENCYFKDLGLELGLSNPEETLKNSVQPGTSKNTKRTKSESHEKNVQKLSKDLSAANISEKKKNRWHSKSESNNKQEKQKYNNTKPKK